MMFQSPIVSEGYPYEPRKSNGFRQNGEQMERERSNGMRPNGRRVSEKRSGGKRKIEGAKAKGKGKGRIKQTARERERTKGKGNGKRAERKGKERDIENVRERKPISKIIKTTATNPYPPPIKRQYFTTNQSKN